MAREAMTAKFWLSYGDDGILRVKIHELAHIDVADAEVYADQCGRITDGKRVAALVDASVPHTITRAAQEVFAQLSHLRIATAVVTTNSVAIMFTNLFVTLFKPAAPVRTFRSEEEALEWLQKIIAQESAGS